MDSRTLLVRRTTWESHGVLSVGLEDPAGAPLPVWEPGAHIDLAISDEFVRQYSLCGDPDDERSWRVAILREEGGRGGSQSAHALLRAGTTVQVTGPRSRFPLVAAPGYLFVAGGIGITPILPMLRAASRDRVPWTLLYGGRSRTSMAFLGELERYGEQVSVVPEDQAGRLDLKPVIGAAAPATAVYCCGPGPLIDAVVAVCQDLGRPAPHVERFTPGPARDVVPGDAGFDVVLERSGLAGRVPPELTILEALERAGVRPLSSCREGYCGTCEVGVVAGEIDHRDEYLTGTARASGRAIMICSSRARGEALVLDL